MWEISVIEISEMENVKLSENISINVVRGSDFILKEIWEDKIYDIDYKIKENDVVFDIGANQGIFSIYAASKGAQVHSCEPVPSNYKILIDNITKNSMNNIITPINYAISSIEDSVILKLPKADEICPTGMGSISSSSIESLKENIQFDTIDIPVKTKTLDDWIDLTDVKQIDLMKIDCEGAEIDILETLSLENAAKIKNIVMETHRGYDEKDLVTILNNLGFKITRYQPVSGLYGGGALFATRDLNAAVDNQIVCDVKNSPKYVYCNSPFIIDASSSFLIGNTSTELSYTWLLDNEVISIDNILKFHFDNPGYNELELLITSNNITNKAHIKIWSFLRKEILTENTILIEDIDLDFHPILKNSYVIKKDFFPKGWNNKSINLSFELKNYKDVIQGYVYHNGIRYPFESPSIEISLKYYPNNKDIKFSIILFEENQIRIGWWADRDSYNENTVKKSVVGFINSNNRIPFGEESTFDASESFCTGLETSLHYKWNNNNSYNSEKFNYLPKCCGNENIKLEIECDGKSYSYNKNVYVYDPTFNYNNVINLTNDTLCNTQFNRDETKYFSFESDVEFWEESGIKLEVFCHDYSNEPLGWFRFENRVVTLYGGTNTFELPIDYSRNKNIFSISVFKKVSIDIVGWNINKQIDNFIYNSYLFSHFKTPKIITTSDEINLDCTYASMSGKYRDTNIKWLFNETEISNEKSFSLKPDKTGKHTIKLNLSNSNEISICENSIFIFPSFSDKIDKFYLNQDGIETRIAKNSQIIIPSEIFPKEWNPNKITLQFISGHLPLAGSFDWFDSLKKVNGYFTQIELDLFNEIKNVDYSFLCKFEEDCDIKISYWFS